MILGIIMSLVIPSLSVIASWYSKQAAVTEMIYTVKEQMQRQKLENEIRFAKQADLKVISKALQNISSTLVELKTDIKYLKHTDKKRR